MPFQFRKRIKIAPGLHLNVGKKGVSASVGVRGANMTIGKGRVTRSIGLPGTGLYDRATTTSTPAVKPLASHTPQGKPMNPFVAWLIAAAVIGAVTAGLWLSR